MKKRFMYLILPIITLILEILPYGAVLNFANPEGEPFRESFSYFSMIPFGYANFAPLITAILTCIIFMMLVLFCFKGKESIATKAKYVTGVAMVISFGPLLYGIKSFSVVGLLISLSLIAEYILLIAKERNSYVNRCK